jgi:hypothetical protein
MLDAEWTPEPSAAGMIMQIEKSSLKSLGLEPVTFRPVVQSFNQFS